MRGVYFGGFLASGGESALQACDQLWMPSRDMMFSMNTYTSEIKGNTLHYCSVISL